jgi:hypothetical protein
MIRPASHGPSIAPNFAIEVAQAALFARIDGR